MFTPLAQDLWTRTVWGSLVSMLTLGDVSATQYIDIILPKSGIYSDFVV